MTDEQLNSLRAKVHAVTRPEKALLLMYVLTSLMACFAFPFVLVPLFFRYETLKYRFDDEGIFMSYGVLFHRQLQLTYSRMQDIHLSQNLLERWLGIGTVTIQTAGAGAGSDMAIVGVSDAEAIRDYLYARMRGVRETKPDAAAGSAEGLLHEIRDALTDTATALSKTRGLP